MLAENETRLSRFAVAKHFLKLYWKAIFFVAWPCICSFAFFLGEPFERKFSCLFVLLLMAGYWVTECIPLYITGMFPVFFFPMLGIMSTSDTCMEYFKSTNWMLVIGIFLATAVEYCGLHMRIALLTVIGFTTRPRLLSLGTLSITAFLSMWLPNSATTAMMCPILEAVLIEMEKQGIGAMYLPKNPDDDEDEPPRPSKQTVCYYLGIAYASSIGGLGTLIGTPTNLTYKGIFESLLPDAGEQIDFVRFMFLNVPILIINIGCLWFALQIMLMGMLRPNSREGKMVAEANKTWHLTQEVIKQKYKELGPWSWHEKVVLVLFITIIILWFTRMPMFFTGWADLLKRKGLTAATPGMLIVFLFFLIPHTLQCCTHGCTRDMENRPLQASPGIVSWSILESKMPWGIVFVLGGGFALSKGGNQTKMSHYLGDKLKGLKSIPDIGILLITSLLCNWTTELTANVAVTNVTIPILINMSLIMNVHPLLFTLPAAMNCNYAMALPSGTPPNAIVQEKANIRLTDMMKYGVVVKHLCYLVSCFMFMTYGKLFYDLSSFPDWAKPSNSTTS